MARSPANPGRQRHIGIRATATLLACLATGVFTPAPAAGPAGDITIKAETSRFEDGGLWLEDKVQVSHGRDTRISSARALVVDKPGNIVELDFSSNVHVEFRDAVLNADSAFMVIRGEELLSVAVKGSQARFSHQRKDSNRRIEGRADAIAYDRGSNEVRFSGHTFWTDGRYDLNTDVVVYNIQTGSYYSPTLGELVRRGRDREQQDVPPPRTPERSTAQ